MNSGLTREPPKTSKHLRRNEGSISTILEAVRLKLTQAVETEGFWGKIPFEIEIVNQDITTANIGSIQTIKLK